VIRQTLRITSALTALLLAPAAQASEAGTGYELEPPDTVACPADPILLNDLNVAAGWRHEGTTESQDAHGEGTCGGGAGDVVYRFVAPVAGDYTFRVTGRELPADDADPVLYIRTACGPGGTELACADDAPDATLNPELALALQQDQAILVFVDGYLDEDVGAWRGPYTLEVSTEALIEPPLEGPYLHMCRCPSGRTGALCSNLPCGDTSDCETYFCGPEDAGATVDACYGGQDGCFAPDPPTGPGLLYCECASGYNAALGVENALCDANDGSDTSAPAVACASHCGRLTGTASGRMLCDRDSAARGAARECPTNQDGAFWIPRAICDAADAAALDCSGSRGSGNGAGDIVNSVFYALEGCGCGCFNTELGCPDPGAPGVHYKSHDARECTQMDLTCPAGQTRFFRPQCGCGCEEAPASSCPGPAAPVGPEPGNGYRETAEWAACQAGNVPQCVGQEQIYYQQECGCGCYTNPHDEIFNDDSANPTYYAFGAAYCVGTGLRCGENQRKFASPFYCGCTFDTGVCPEYDAASRIISRDYEVCRADGVFCPEGEHPFLHPLCGCGCIPD
jgi:hypothetical protein